MTVPSTARLPDIQSLSDHRNLPIEAVGIKGMRYPVTIRSGGEHRATVADFAMTVALPGRVKGTHMSRFVEVLEAQRDALDPAAFRRLVETMLARLGAEAGAVEMRFTWFARKVAPSSGV